MSLRFVIVSGQLNYIKTRWFHAIFMPVIIEFSRCIGTYSSAKFELITALLTSAYKSICRISLQQRLFFYPISVVSLYLHSHITP